MPDKEEVQLERFQLERELNKAQEKLKDERQTVTCGSIGCGTILLIATIVSFIVFSKKPAIGVGVLIVSGVFLALVIYGGKRDMDKAQSRVALYRGQVNGLLRTEAEIDVGKELAQSQAVEAPPEQATQPAGSRDCSLVLVSCPSDRELAIASLRDEFDLELAEAVVLIDQVPTTLRASISQDAAELIERRLTKKGFDIEIVHRA